MAWLIVSLSEIPVSAVELARTVILGIMVLCKSFVGALFVIWGERVQEP